MVKTKTCQHSPFTRVRLRRGNGISATGIGMDEQRVGLELRQNKRRLRFDAPGKYNLIF